MSLSKSVSAPTGTHFWVFACIAFIVLCACGVGGYFLYRKFHSSQSTDDSSGPSGPPGPPAPSGPPASGPPPPSGPPAHPAIHLSSAPYLNQPEVFGVEFALFASVFSTSGTLPTVDAATGQVKLANSPLKADVLKSILPAGYTLASVDQLKSAQLDGMQMPPGSWGLCVGSDGNVNGACPKQVAFVSSNPTEKIQVLYNPHQNVMITAPQTSPVAATVPNAIYLFGVKPAWNSSGSFVSLGVNNNSAQCKIYPWYNIMNNEPSPSDIWSEFDTHSICALHPTQCMLPLQITVAGQKNFVIVSQQTSGVYDISQTPTSYLAGILTSDGTLLFQTTQVENDANGSIPAGSFISMNVLDIDALWDFVSFLSGDFNPNIIAASPSTNKFTMNSAGQLTTTVTGGTSIYLDGLTAYPFGDSNYSIGAVRNQTYWAKFAFAGP